MIIQTLNQKNTMQFAVIFIGKENGGLNIEVLNV